MRVPRLASPGATVGGGVLGQVFDHIGALALAHHPQPTGLPLERSGVAQRPHLALELPILVAQLAKLLLLGAGGARLLDPMLGGRDIEEQDRNERREKGAAADAVP